MATPEKDTIYIDVDDEITGIIDKLRNSDGKIVALVLPKRAGVFQSIVNMKLLKRAADDSKKHLVLITSEVGLLPLAGVAGIHVAKTLTSKPEIPVAPTADDTEENVDEAGDDLAEVTAETAGDKPIGELAGAAAVAAVAADGVETIELDDDELPEDALDLPEAKTTKKTGPKKDKKLQVPDFDRFRLILIIGGALLLFLIIFGYFAMNVLPKATISIDTDASAVNASVNLNLSTTATTLNPEDNTIPAKQVQQAKTYTQSAPATGQKNNGNKASGSVSVVNCSDNDVSVPAGTGLSSGGNTYISQQTVTVPASDFFSNGTCKKNHSAPINIIAQNGGATYNMSSGASFAISGFSRLTGSGGTISGGTDNIVTIVSQGDVNAAKDKINTDDPTIKQALLNQLKQDGYYAVPATFSAGTPTVTTSPGVGEAGTTVTVTEAVTYTMFGVKEDDLKTVVDNSVKDQIDTNKQKILSQGLDTATFNVTALTATGGQLTMSTTATAGPELDIDAIKKDAAGKKPGDVKSSLSANPDVKSVNVKLSPFWVSSVPKKTSKITVTIAKPTVQASKSNASNP